MLYREMPKQIAFINQKSTVDLYIKIRGDYRLFAARGALLPDEQYRHWFCVVHVVVPFIDFLVL